MKVYKKILILIFLVSQISTAKFKTEVSLGLETSLGVDNLSNGVDYVKPLLNLAIPKQFEDYEKINNNTSKPNNSPQKNNTNLYQPIVNPNQRDLFLATKYLGQKVRLYKTFDIKFSEDYSGLSAYIQGKTSVKDNDKINNLKLGINSSNKYLSGYIYSYIKGEVNKKYGLDKLDSEEETKNKAVNYAFSLNPLPDSVASITFDVKGQDKYVHLGPTLRIKKDGFFLNLGYERVPNADPRKVYVKDEIINLKAAAPGYNKIEYFKKWTLKKIADKDYDYEKDRADLEKAEVSGYKGTSRILGLYSGSLYGDLPVKYVLQRTDKILAGDKKYAPLKKGLDYITGRNFLPDLTLINDLVRGVDFEKLGTDLSKDIISDLYERIGFDPDAKYSSIGIWNQIPDDFVGALPRRDRPWDFGKLSLISDPNRLYFDGLDKAHMLGETITPKLADSGSNTKEKNTKPSKKILDKSGKYEKLNKWHYLGDDIEKNVLNELSNIHSNSFKILKELSKKENIAGNAFKIAFGGLNSLRDNLYNDPYEMPGIDMLRGIYLHRSEKGKNEFELYQNLKSIVKDIEDAPATKMSKDIFKFEVGYAKDDYLVKLSASSNEKINIKNANYSYEKIKNKFGLDFNVNKKGLIFNSSTELIKSKNAFSKKNTEFKYDLYDITTNNYLGYRFNASDKVEIELGLGHIGEFGYLKNPKLIIDGKEYKKNVAIRDKDNKPIGKDGKAIDTLKTTEKALIDKEIANGNKNVKRNINASDYIKTEEKSAKSSWYNIYNIVYPKLVVSSKPNKNLILTNEIKLPIGIVNNKFDGFNAIYTGKVTYLLDDNDIIDKITTDFDIFNFNTSGDVKLSTRLDEVFKYRFVFDIGFAKLNLHGKNNKFNFDLVANPLVYNFKVKPQIGISKEDNNYVAKFGIANTGDNILNVGTRKIIKTTNDYYKNNIKEPILYVLKNRKEAEYKHIKDILVDDIYGFDSNNIKYNLSPYIEISNNDFEISNVKSKFTYSIKGSSNIGYGEETTTSAPVVTEDKEFKFEKSMDEYAKNYIYWSWQHTKDSNKDYLYVSKVNKYKDKVTKTVTSNKKIKLREFDLKFKLNYGENLGLRINSDSTLNYKNVSVDISNSINKDISRTTQNAIYLIKADGSYKTSEFQELDKNNIPGEIIKAFKEKVRPNYFYCKNGLCLSYDSENQVRNNPKLTLESPKISGENKKSTEKANLSVKEINFNTDNYIGYGLKANDKLNINLGLGHNLNIRHTSIGNVIIGDTKLYASSKLDIKHIIEPKITLEYSILKNLNLNTTIGAPIKFIGNNVKDNKVVDIHLDLRYRW
ncbi:hypothetical protein [Oceanivirga salmonicida]|uniref:hypothetical protein n=1 Tax=Oceanivirga salmonicida TaxID=1769291 RepID=UPI0012E23ACE|nr:hypothetical protein [Oceanivirga salmonicida]